MDGAVAPAPRILPTEAFEVVAQGGLGHPGSTFAHSMAWFRGRLYVGTSAPSARDEEERARIVARDPATGEWETVFESPVLPLDASAQARARGMTQTAGGGQRRQEDTATRMGREYGLRSMCVFQGKSDSAPCLYVGTMSIWGGLILRSEDGRTFEPVTAPGIDDDTQMSFRGLTALNGLLFTAPAGTVTEERMDRNLAPRAVVYVTDDPVAGQWREACLPAFGDPMNVGVFALATAHGQVYAGTGSPQHGFQLWRTKAEGEAPYEWERVLTHGAWRFNHNLSVAELIEFDGDVYVGSGIAGFGYDRENDVGPCAAEILRVHPDGSWDLLVGEPRFTPDGLKVPLSAMGPGFDDAYNSVIWNFEVHDGVLYAGTHQWEPYHWAMHGKGAPIRGGYQLWATTDGEEWVRVLTDGHGKTTSIGIRTLCSTPDGLYVGTTNYSKLISRLARGLSGVDMSGMDLTEGFEVLLARRERA
jgi:hypothetical protein